MVHATHNFKSKGIKLKKIGILAYGSLIEDSGIEIEPLIQTRIENIKTPFKIEFARSSLSRNGAPTLVEYDDGLTVNGQILLLKDSVTLEHAKDILWRRETRNEKSGRKYIEAKNPPLNKVVVEVLENFKDIDYVLYTKIGANIENPTAEKLANLAIESAKKDAGKKEKMALVI